MTGPTTTPADTTTEAAPVKETAAQRVERIKREKASWSILDDIRRYSREGFTSISNEDLTVRFRAWGLYTQGDGRGTRGDEMPFFMMRVRTPNGLLTSAMVRRIADISDTYARGSIDITNRQNFQLHWLRIEDIPTIWESLDEVGWTSMGACGDNTRTVTGCSLAGVEHDELIDASPIAVAVDKFLNGNPDYANLPRKFKITITGCTHWCSYPEINDIGMTAIRHPETGEVGFSVRVGGGLSTDPHLAVRLDAFVHWNQVLPVVRGISELFRDSAVLRENREKARLKFLFLAHGWTAQRFQEELERRIGFHLDPAVHEDPPDDVYRDHVGIHDQKQAGYCHVGLPVLRGRLTPGQMRALADVADRYGSGELRTTSMQNILIPNVRRERAQALARAIEAAGLRLEGSPFWRGTIACTGTEFCKLALTETKNFARWLVEDLETRLPGFDQHVKIHVTGCPNSCGQHWIADIGIEGKKVKVEGQMVDAYYFCVGGGVGKHQAKARPIGYRIAAAEVPGAIERLLRVYLGDRRDGENFRQFSGRHTDEALRAFLAWEPVAPVARDASPGRPPRDVDG